MIWCLEFKIYAMLRHASRQLKNDKPYLFLVLIVLSLIIIPPTFFKKKIIYKSQAGANRYLSANLTTGDQREMSPGNWNKGYASVACSSKESKCLIIWRDKRNDPGNENDGGADNAGYYGANSNADIYGQLVKGDGTVINRDFAIATDPSSSSWKVDQANPEVIYNPNRDEFLAVWHEGDPNATDKTNDGYCTQGGYNLHGQRIKPDGSFVGNKIAISTATDCQWKPRVAYDISRDIYFIAWHDHRFRRQEMEKELYGQFLKGDGSLLGTDFRVSRDLADPVNGPEGYQEYPSIAYNPDTKDFLIVWGDDRDTPSGQIFQFDIWGQRLYYDNGLNFEGQNFPIYKAAGVQEKPEITYDAYNKQYFIVWQNKVANNSKPIGQLLSGNGSLVGTPFDIDSERSYVPFPAVATDETNGNKLVAWETGRTYVQAWSQTGQPASDKADIGASSYIRPPVTYNSFDKNFMIAYSDSGSSNGGYTKLFYRTVKLNSGNVTPLPTEDQIPTDAVTSPTPIPTEPQGGITSTPVPIITPDYTSSFNDGQGVFQCHADHKIYEADYIKGGAIIILWGKLQPDNSDSFNSTELSNIKNRIRRAGESGKKITLFFLVYKDQTDGANSLSDTLPGWLKTDVVNFGSSVYPQPWSNDYQTKLKKFLTLFYGELEKNNLVKYLEYVEPAAGGIWSSTHLWIADDYFKIWIKAAGCAETDTKCFGQKYNQGLTAVISTYLDSFKDVPVNLIGGSCKSSDCNFNGINNLLDKYGMKIQYKLAGIGHNSDSLCGLHTDLFKSLCSNKAGDRMTKCGQEPWGDNIQCGGVGFDPNKGCGKDYQQIYEESLQKERVSYYCIYGDDISCTQNQSTNQYVANHVGAQINLVSYQLSSNSVSVNNNLSLNFKWKNTGSTALIGPVKLASGKWQPSSYKLFLEFEKNNQVVHYQELVLNPGTDTWQPDNLLYEGSTTTDIVIPSSLGSTDGSSGITYKVYAGLTDPNGERKRFILTNNDSKHDRSKRRYLVSDAFQVTGQGTVPTLTPAITGVDGCSYNNNENGDIDNSGNIDLIDKDLWLTDYQKSQCQAIACYQGDISHDGKVCLSDLEIWRRNYLTP